MRLPLGPKGLVFLLGVIFASGGSLAWADGGKTGESQGTQHAESGGSSGQGSGSSSASHEDGDGGKTADNGSSTASGDDGKTGNVSDLHELNESPEKEQEEARQAVATGKAAPLTRLLQKLKTDYPGQILDVGLVRLPTKLKFSVKYIDTNGVVKTVTLDALTLEDD